MSLEDVFMKESLIMTEIRQDCQREKETFEANFQEFERIRIEKEKNLGVKFQIRD